MTVKAEIQEWLLRNLKKSLKNTHRDTQIILSRYGFLDDPRPTFESILKRFNMDKTRQRVEQIIKNKFRSKVRLELLPETRKTIEYLSRIHWEHASILRNTLVTEGRLEPTTHLSGILQLAKDFGFLKNLEFYDCTLNPIKKHSFGTEKRVFLIEGATQKRLNPLVKKALSFPGRLGIARLDQLEEHLGPAAKELKLTEFIKSNDHACLISEANHTWFLIENRVNTLVNFCSKIKNLTNTCNIDVLTSALTRGLLRNSSNYQYPSCAIIKKWITRSSKFAHHGDLVDFLGSIVALSPIEKEIQAYLSQNAPCDGPDLVKHLEALNHTNPACQKAVYNSPLVHIDTSQGRTRYRISSIASEISNSSGNGEHSQTRYDQFKNKLGKLLQGGTDRDVEALARREQDILRSYLFDGKEAMECAICGKAFKTQAMVAAHKKPREICLDSERVDPHIVFPLCLFGCDYLYEHSILLVKAGKVVECSGHDGTTWDQRQALSLDGRTLLPRWLEGEPSYFDKPGAK